MSIGSSDIRLTKERMAEGTTSIGSRSATSYETRHTGSHYDTDVSSVYKSSIAPRHLVIQRTISSGLGSGARSVSSSRSGYEKAMAMGLGAPSGAYATVTSNGVNAVKSSRDKEKKDMQDLNERFAGYIEKVRFLEVQNRKLADELEKLKARWGKETTQIKAMYQAELDEARRLLDDAEKDKARLEIRAASLEEQLEESRQRLLWNILVILL